jgi:hypothetical protein
LHKANAALCDAACLPAPNTTAYYTAFALIPHAGQLARLNTFLKQTEKNLEDYHIFRLLEEGKLFLECTELFNPELKKYNITPKDIKAN